EISMAKMLVESMAGDFEPEGHVDDFKEALDALVQSKIEGGDVTEAPESEEEADSGEVVDLLAALQRSVDRAKKGRGEKTDDDAEDADDPKKSTATSSGSSKSSSTSSGSKGTAKKAASKTAAKK